MLSVLGCHLVQQEHKASSLWYGSTMATGPLCAGATWTTGREEHGPCCGLSSLLCTCQLFLNFSVPCSP